MHEFSEEEEEDLYALLGIHQFASCAEIRKGYRQAALHTHPDKAGGSTHAFHKVSVAFEVLSCPTARHLYDSSRHLSCKQAFSNSCKKTSRKVITCNRVQVRKRSAARTLDPRDCPKQRCLDPTVSNNSRRITAKSWEKGISVEFAIKTNRALSQLQDILQSLSPESRLASITSILDNNTRIALASFIESSRKTKDASSCRHSSLQKSSRAEMKAVNTKRISRNSCNVPLSGFSGIRAMSGSLYKAYIDIKALRLYTRGHSTIEDAIDQHIALVSLRHALRAANCKDPDMWEAYVDTQSIYRMCTNVLTSHGTSEDELGLSAIVSLRADRWLGRGHHITSPMMPLAEALQVHGNILRARSVSWNALRSEWVSLMLRKKRSLKSSLSLAEAQTRADKARQGALKYKLARAVRKVVVALNQERRRTARALKLEDRRISLEKRQKEIHAKNMLAARRRALKARFQWMRRRDLTVDDMLFGAPPLL